MAGNLFCAANATIRSRRVSRGGVSGHEKGADALLNDRCKTSAQLRVIAGSDNVKSLRGNLCRLFQSCKLASSRRKVRVEKNPNNTNVWQQIMKQAQALWLQFVGQQRKACRVSTRPAKALDLPRFDGIAYHPKDNWCRLGCLHCCHGQKYSADRDNDANALNEASAANDGS